MASRIEPIQDRLSELAANAVLLTFLADIRWACGFTGSNGVLLVREDDAIFLTDGRYETQAASEVSGARVIMGGYDLIGFAAEHDLLEGCESVAFQSDHVSVAVLEKLEEHFPGIAWQGVENLLVKEVASKSEDEVRRIRAAQEITEDVFDGLLGWISAGMTEKEVAAEIVYRHLRAGAERMAFEPIAASGPNAALPHGLPTDRQIQRGDVLLLDFGCFLDGYASDMTRTVFVGEAAPDAVTVYELVRNAQEQAIHAARAGVKSVDLDTVSRNVIKEAGYGEHFSHSLGHGVGLQVHEWPRVSYSVDYELPRDCVVTIEPGIYLPGRFGIRIEDLVVLREDGAENLTRVPKDIIVL